MSSFRPRASTRTELVLLVVFGIIIREVFAPFTGHPYDFELWVRLGYYVSQGLDPYVSHPPVPGLSFPTFEGPPTWPGYPPIWPLFLALIYKFYVLTGIQNRFFYYFLIKQPMIIADILIAYLIFRLVRTHSTQANAFRAFTFWLLCPYTILISAIWGMFDQIVFLIVIAALYLITSPWKSSILEAFATAVKLIPAIYFLLFAAIQSSRRKIATYIIAGGVLSLLLAFAPYLFFRNWNVAGLTGVGVDVTNKFSNSMNYWEILFLYNLNHPISSSEFFYLQIIGWIWIPCILLATYFCVMKIRHGENFQRNLMLSSLFITLTFFLTKYVINEQFLIYFLGFALFDYYVVSSKLRRKLFHAIWLTALVFLTMNNAFLIRFLSPLSTYYGQLNDYLVHGQFAVIRNDLLMVTAILFSVISFGYLYSLFTQLKELNVKEKKFTTKIEIPS